MVFAKFHSRAASMPDAVYLEVIATLYGTTVPILVAGVCQAVVGTISVAQTGADLPSAANLGPSLLANHWIS